MKKFVYGLFLLIAAISIMNCEKEKLIPGEVGRPVYLVPDVEARSDTSGCTFNWTFDEKPTNSALSILNFQPSSNGYNIYFIPDVSGDFKVKCDVLTKNGTLKQQSIFLCKIKPSTKTSKKPVVSGTISEKPKELAPVYLEDSKEESQQKSIPKEIESETKPNNSTIKTPPPKQNLPTQKGLYTIQISSFRTYANAEKELNELKNLGMQNIFIKKTYIKSKDEVWYRIRTKSFATITQARSELSQIKSKYKRSSAWIDKID